MGYEGEAQFLRSGLRFSMEQSTLPNPMELAQLFPASARFRPLRLLGRGGMGAVFAAEDALTGGRVALKVMLSSSPEALLSFKQEFRTVADLSHPNLVRLLELFHENNRWFFTMEMVDGQDLRSTLLEELEEPSTESTLSVFSPEKLGAPWPELPGRREHRAPACDAEALRHVLTQVVDGLGHLHHQGVTHRDLKPTNVLVGIDGRVRLADFGLARRFEPGEPRSSPASTAGTLAYMAPELWQGAEAGPASDRYALGCMMYELLTGQLPYEKPPSWQRHPEVERPRIEDRVDGVPAPLAELAWGLISPRPGERPGLDEVRRVLRAPARASGRAPAAAVFVGREEELRQIDAALTAVAGGEARTLVLMGPSGIGKSSLAAKIAEMAREEGFLVLQGRCHEREQMPFAAIDRPIDALVEHLRGSVDEVIAPIVQALRPMFPVLDALGGVGLPGAGGAQNPPSGDAEDAAALRARGLRAFASLLEELQARRPTALLIDDLHWIDEDSVSLLTELLSRARGRLLILLALRDDPPPRVRQLVEVARRAAGGSQIDLRPLALLEVNELLEKLGAAAPARQSAAAAEGNPFLVQLLASGPLSGLGALGALVAARLGELSPEGQHLLRLLSVLNGDAPTGVLRGASELLPAAFEQGTAELVAARLARTRPGGQQPRLGVYHDRIREGVDETLDREGRQRLHARLGAVFEEHGAPTETLLYHWTGAGDRERRRRYGRLAAAEAERKLAFARAGQLCAELLAEGEDAENVLAWEHAGDLLRLSGHVEQAVGPYRRARRLQELVERPSGDPTPVLLRISGHLAESLIRSGEVAEGRAEWVRGQALLGLPLGRPAPLRMPLLTGLAVRSWVEEKRHRHGARPEKPLTRAQIDFLNAQFRTLLPYWPATAFEAALRCEALAHQIGDAAVTQRLLAFRGLARAFVERPTDARLAEAARLLRVAAEMAERSGNVIEGALVTMGHATMLASREPAGAAAWMQRAIDRLEEAGLGEATEACMARGMRLMLLHIAEEHESSLAASQAELTRARPDFGNTVYALWTQIRVRLIRGQQREAHEAERQLEAHLERTPPNDLMVPLWSVRMMRAWSESQSAAALSHAERAARASPERLPQISPFLRALWYATPFDAAIDLARSGRLPRRKLEQTTAEAREGSRLPWFGCACLGHRALGLLALAARRESEGRDHLRRALALSQSEPAYRRWLCLEAARPLGLLTAHELAEARRLTDEGGFVLAL